MNTLVNLLLILEGAFQCPTTFQANQLFEAMEGHWTGKGTSTWEGNRQVTHFTSETFSTRTPQGLISKNTWTTEDSGKVTPSTYLITLDEKNPCQSGKFQYLLSITEHQLEGTGVYDGSRFESVQPLQQGYSVVTRSQFLGDRTLQVSRLVDKDQSTLSTTRIEHIRVK